MPRIRLVKPPPKAANNPTRHLYVSGVGAALGHTEKDIEPLFSPYGIIDCIELVTDSRFVFVSFLHVDSAIRAMEQSKLMPPVPPFPSASTTTASTNTGNTNTTKIFLKYAMEAKPVGPLVVEPDCTSTTADIHVPGTFILCFFYSIMTFVLSIGTTTIVHSLIIEPTMTLPFIFCLFYSALSPSYLH